MNPQDVLKPSYWEQIVAKFYDLLITKGLEIASAILILVIGFFIIGKIAKGVRLAIVSKTEDLALGEFTEQITRIVLKIMLFLSVASQIGIETTSFVAALGAAGLAIGMALQGSLSNFAGGVLILVLKPFKIGDTIDSLGHIGEVVRISVLQTKLMTPDHKLVILPNGKVANTELVNYTSPTKRRSEFTIKIGYDEDIQKVRQIILAELNKVENIYKDPLPTVAVNKLGEVNVEILTRFWTDNGHQLGAMNDSLEAIKTTFQSQNVKITQVIQKIELIKDSN
jgi:small conductance mechanosensitive channel